MKPGYIWAPGYWNNTVWVDGYWRQAQKSNFVWVPGHYDSNGVRIKGHWKWEESRGVFPSHCNCSPRKTDTSLHPSFPNLFCTCQPTIPYGRNWYISIWRKPSVYCFTLSEMGRLNIRKILRASGLGHDFQRDDFVKFSCCSVMSLMTYSPQIGT